MGSISNIVGLGGLFATREPAPPPPPPPPPVPTRDDPAVIQRREELRLSLLRRRGRASTILTSGLGDSSSPAVRRTTLGGV